MRITNHLRRRAVTWATAGLAVAADLGLASAQYALSLAYSSGLGVPPDQVAAYEWMDLAVFRARGPIREKYSAARDALTAGMTPEQLAEARRRAGEWKTKWPH